MVQLIVGDRGKGKTKHLLDSANEAVKNATGNIVYLDKNSKHMFELDRSIRLINVREYPVADLDVLMGFVCGLISGNHDIESIYFDSFLILANLEDQDPTEAIDKMIVLSDRLGVEFIISVSLAANELDSKFQDILDKSL